MSATTTEGTGPGAVERYLPRTYNNQIRLENIINLNELQQKIEITPPARLDGGIVSIMSLNALSEEDLGTIMKAAEILKSLK